jgi:hypothetical protein
MIKKKIIIALIVLITLFMSPVVKATPDLNVRVLGRGVSVLSTDVKWTPTWVGGSTIDEIVLQLKYMQVDSITFPISSCYFLREMSEDGLIPATFKDPITGVVGNYSHQASRTFLDEAIAKLHAANITVIFTSVAGYKVAPMWSTLCNEEYYEGDKYSPVNMKGIKINPDYLDLAYPEARKKIIDMQIYAITHHDFDGIWFEEIGQDSASMNFYTGTLADRSDSTNRIRQTWCSEVQNEYGYNPCLISGTLSATQILQAVQQKEHGMNSYFEEFKARRDALGPDYAYPYFFAMPATNQYYYDKTLSSGSNGAGTGFNITYLSESGLIDIHGSESINQVTSHAQSEVIINKHVDFSPKIFHATDVLYGSKGASGNSKKLYEQIQAEGTQAEFWFSYGKRNLVNIDTSVVPFGLWCTTFKGTPYGNSVALWTNSSDSSQCKLQMTWAQWQNQNPPANPRNFNPIGKTATSTSVSAPTFFPPSGTYISPQSVSISTSTSGAVIHYTVDGSTPTESSPTYTSPISISSTTTIKAGAWKTSLTPSTISTAVYTITDPDTTSPVISSISSSPSSSGATITWATNEASDSQIEYGISTSYGSSTALNTALLTSHSQSLTDLTPSTLYHYRVKSKDSSGNLATGTDNTFTTLIYTPSANLLTNPGFESGTSSWTFFTDGIGSFATISPGYELTKAAKISLNTVGSNMQFYQSGISLEPNTSYRLTFSAYSSTGHDFKINLLKNISPYTNYGLIYTPDLTISWQTFTQDFTTSGFTNNVTDGRLQFYFPTLASAGDIYYLDDFKLEKVTPSVADLNSDSIVNSVDFGIMMSFWNYTSKPKADINQDGFVNSQDLGMLMSQWG